MARTINGNYTGAAAHLTQADADENFMHLMDDIHEHKDRIVDLRDQLKAIDPEGWEAWWDTCLPDWNYWGDINYWKAIHMLEERIKEAQFEIFSQDTRQTLESVRPY
jgi:hypothetical protein